MFAGLQKQSLLLTMMSHMNIASPPLPPKTEKFKTKLTIAIFVAVSKKRVVKGIFVTRDRPFFFPVKCEIAIFCPRES